VLGSENDAGCWRTADLDVGCQKFHPKIEDPGLQPGVAAQNPALRKIFKDN